MNKISLFILASVIFALNGCSSQVVNYDRYSLIEDVSAISIQSNYNVEVSLNEILNQPGIVLKTSDVSLRSANKHLWSSSLRSQLESIFKDVLYKENFAKNTSFAIYVNKFNGALDGTVEIDLSVNVFKNNKQILFKNYVRKGKQDTSGYDALVIKLKDFYKEICKEIVTDLR